MENNLNFKPSTIWTGDNLEIMRGMNSECADLIYLDPPFNSKANYCAPIGSPAEGSEFKDIWSLKEVHNEWVDLIAETHEDVLNIIRASMTDSNKSYLCYMAIRIIEMHRILKKTGTLFLHCDPTMSHWLKIILDRIFGIDNFRNEIVWHYRTYQGNVKVYYPKKHDVIFWYSKSEKNFRGNDVFELEYFDNYEDTVDFHRWRKFYKEGNKIFYGHHPETDSRFSDYLKKWIKENCREPRENEVIYECKGYVVDDVWVDIQAIDPKDTTEKTGYPTQKPLLLLERIIKASTKVGDFVFDPFCGCATTLVAADRLRRKWAGIDISPKAVELVNKRITKDREEEGALHRAVDDRGRWNGAIERTDIPLRTDLGKVPNYKTHHRALYGEQEGRCKGCGQSFDFRNTVVDHIIAVSRGGTDHKENLQVLCFGCNNDKGAKGMDHLMEKLKIGRK